MDVLPGFDVLGRDADDLVVAPHRLARSDAPGGYLVARWDQTRHHQIFFGDALAADQLATGDHHIIVGVEPDNGRGRLHP